jgi:hypothetical protein
MGIRKHLRAEMTADDVFLLANWIGVLALAIGVICACTIAISGKIRDDRLKSELSQSEIKLAKMRADNLATEGIIAPREFPVNGTNGDAVPINEELKEKFSGTKVWVQTVPDFESTRLTVSLFGLFRAVSWIAQEVGPSETGVSPLGISEGVKILLRYPYSSFPPPPDAPPDKLLAAAKSLVKRLQITLGDNFFSIHDEFTTIPMPTFPGVDTSYIPPIPPIPPSAKVPDDTLLILVGMKPIGALISEKNAKASSPSQQPNK